VCVLWPVSSSTFASRTWAEVLVGHRHEDAAGDCGRLLDDGRRWWRFPGEFNRDRKTHDELVALTRHGTVGFHRPSCIPTVFNEASADAHHPLTRTFERIVIDLQRTSRRCRAKPAARVPRCRCPRNSHTLAVAHSASTVRRNLPLRRVLAGVVEEDARS